MLHHEELRLADYLVYTARIGYDILSKHIPIYVKEILEEYNESVPDSPREVHFVDNLPSKSWTTKFLSRHPILSFRAPEKPGAHRKKINITEEKIREWFDELDNFLLEDHKIDSNLFMSEGNAHRIFNADMCGFPLDESTGKKPDICMSFT